MHFKVVSGVGNKLLCQLCRSSIYLNNTSISAQRMLTSNASYKDEDILLFFKSEVQAILKNLTGFDMNKVFQDRKLGEELEPPKYQFMTSKQINEALEKSKKLAEDMIQMPPFVPIRKEIDVVLSEDPELTGLDDCKFIFTDISFGKTDRTRTIVVRDTDGTLRKAHWSERRNANQMYFPRPGKQFKVPKMFQPEYLKPILERGDYVFVLDRVCVEFDPDDPEYHRVTQATFENIEEKSAFGTLRFTRHFGPLVFYLVLNKAIDNLLLENLKTDRLNDAIMLVTLFHIVHPSAASAKLTYQPGQELLMVKEYIEKDSKMKVALDLALMPYTKVSQVQQLA